MKTKTLCLFVSVAIMVTVSSVCLEAQISEVSEITGLPIPIGTSVIYGQVVIKNVSRDQPRPTVVVYLTNGGTQIDKYQASDSGYWYFLRRPADGLTLTFEVEGIEVGKSVIVGGISNTLRQDVQFDYRQLRGSKSTPRPGVISTRDRYPRNQESENVFEKAVTAARDGRNAEALSLLNSIVQNDEKDHNAWMYIGIIEYSNKKYDEARNAYTKALALKPDYFLANLNLGRLELTQKRFDAGIVALVKAVDANGSSADANHLLGEAHLQNKKGSLAVGYLNKAIELDPVGKADLHLRLAALYHGAGLKDRAAREYKTFLEKVKDHPEKKDLEQYIKENLPKK